MEDHESGYLKGGRARNKPCIQPTTQQQQRRKLANEGQSNLYDYAVALEYVIFFAF